MTEPPEEPNLPEKLRKTAPTFQYMWVRTAEGAWLKTGINTQPLRVRMPDGTWKFYGGAGGTPLRTRTKDHEWLNTVTEGMTTGIIYGYITDFDTEIPLINKRVRSFAPSAVAIEDYTDENGYYILKGVPFSSTVINAWRAISGAGATYFITGVDLYDQAVFYSGANEDIEPVYLNDPSKTPNITFTSNDPIHRVDFLLLKAIFPSEYEIGTFNRRPLVPPYIDRPFWTPWDTSGSSPINGVPTSPYAGWYARNITVLGWSDPNGNPYGYDRPMGLLHYPGYEGTNTFFDSVPGVVFGDTVSTITRADPYDGSQAAVINESVGWYSLPIGMFVEDAKTDYEIQKINHPESWAGNAEIESIQIVHRLRGFSAKWSGADYGVQSRAIGSYESVTEWYPGVGALRYQGPTPQDITETVIWQRDPLGSNTANRLYTVPVIRDKVFEREDGDIIWTGNLNDLGWNFVSSGTYVRKPILEITQTFNPNDFSDPRDSLQYHAQTSPLPNPGFGDSGTEGMTIHNRLEVHWTVRILWRYY